MTALVLSVISSRATAVRSSEFPVERLQPTMSVSNASNLTPQEVKRISAGVVAGGATPHVVKFPTISLTAQTRAGKDMFRLGEGWRIPMATMVATSAYVRAIGGDAMADIVARDQVLMGETSAKVRGAQVGDVLLLRDRKFWMRPFTIGAIVADEFVNSGDLFMSSSAAALLGEMPVSQIAITDIVSPASVLSGLKKKGITIGNVYRLRTSWDRKNPDGTLGTATTKKLLGEFSYRPTVGSSILVAGSWTSSNIAWKTRYADIKLGNNCHKLVVEAIQGALTEIKGAGLSRFVNVQNSNRYGGCFVGRYNRLAGNFGAPSRHAWGMAIDINTDTNPQGGVPQMNCAVVRIFRKWGFAWGGNFWPADGMHFEYVGERRDQLGYPSRYCPNKAPLLAVTLPQFGTTTTTTSTTSTLPTEPTTTTTSTTTPATTTTTTTPIT
jgi:hypothetical protein